MADKYFFGRTLFNNGGIARLNFANGTPGFYNAKDQAIYDAGDKFMSQSKYLQNDYIPTEGISYEGDGSPVSYANSMGGIMTQAPASTGYIPQNDGGGGGGGEGPPGDDDEDDENTNNAGLTGWDAIKAAGMFAVNPIGYMASRGINSLVGNINNPYTNALGGLNQATKDAIDNQGRESAPGRGDAGNPGGSSGGMTDDNAGSFCFDPSTPIQMADGSTKEIKDIQLGDDTKGGEVTGVFQFKASDEIHDYKGVTVAGSHYVKEEGKFIMVKDSPLAIKIDKIPVVYSLDTTGRRIFIKDIEFADYNGDGVAKSFLSNAGADLTGFDKEVLRQVEQRLI
jgi:hypothetical protein